MQIHVSTYSYIFFMEMVIVEYSLGNLFLLFFLQF